MYSINICLHPIAEAYNPDTIHPLLQVLYHSFLNIFLSSTYKCNFLGADNKQ